MADDVILVGGENLVDLIQSEQGDGLSYQAKPGGSPFNCAMAIGRQRVTVGYLTPISEDYLGQTLTKALEDSGVELLAQRRAEPTSLAVVSLKNGGPSYQFYRESTAERMITLEGLISNTPKTAEALYIGSLALTDGEDADAWADYYCGMHSKGVFTALDPNIRAAFIHDRTAYIARLNRVFMQTDLLKLSDEDLEWLFPEKNIEVAANMLAKRTSAKLLVVTMGQNGAFALYNAKKVSVKSAPVPNLRDTVGAGDTFMATLLAQLSRNNALISGALAKLDFESVQKLLIVAACAAAINCEREGCDAPTLEELEGALTTRYPLKRSK